MAEALYAAHPPPAESLLTALINDISTIPDRIVVVLDDYHLIDDAAVDRLLAFLVEHLPAQMHLVIATRQDPPLPLARLRVRDQMTEVRAADLRFTAAEAAAFLNQVMNLNLSATDIDALDARTEGWIAGLQLAALSLRDQQDVPRFIRAFAGDHRYIIDYLAEEVLRHQPDAVRAFLLQTAILDRLNGALCDAVTGQADGAGRLEALEQGNFFVVPLDDQRRWYRYHHLFAGVLRAHLREELPERIATLHRRASAWYEQAGSADDAIRHALAAQDFARAADLVEKAWPAMGRSRQESRLLAWLQALPDAEIRCRPVLSVAYAHTLLATGTLTGVEGRLRDAERWLDSGEGTLERPDAPLDGTRPAHQQRMVVVDDEAFRRLPGAIALARAGQALVQGDLPKTVIHARRVLDLVPEHDHLTRGGAAAILGLAAWTRGDLETAHRSYAAGMARIQRAGNIADAIGGSMYLAAIRITQGRLREAMRTYERGVQLAAEHGQPALRGTADMYVGISELLRERGDLHAATEHLLRGEEQGEHTGFPPYPYRWRVAMARIRQAQGDHAAAVGLLDEAEPLYVSDFAPNVCPVAALRTRVWLAQGRLSDARDWAREQGLSEEDDLSYLREFEHITLARVLLARHQSDHAGRSTHEALALLERLLRAAEDGGRLGSALEILVLQALAHQSRGAIPAALAPLERALTLAEPEGYVRLFVDEGPPMVALLEAAAKRGIAPNYVRQLLTDFGKADDRPPVEQGLIEPLSERELDVLRLLDSELDGPEIAHELMVSLNTMRTHTKNIYSKLGVGNRRAAVRRADELALLPRSRKR
ncbi:MAG TPA: LuxR C-terminal-related transcriptional regulator [Thermomicrobiaceae bacterium]|nr:LuxR C-terminal-related transcriptional regulator [Thermomicrobiaceae bacterium]